MINALAEKENKSNQNSIVWSYLYNALELFANKRIRKIYFRFFLLLPSFHSQFDPFKLVFPFFIHFFLHNIKLNTIN